MFAFFGKGLGVQDKVEVAEMFLALTGELNGHHQGDLVVACHVLCVDKWVMVRKVHIAVEKIGGTKERLGDLVEHVGHVLMDAT